MAAMEAGQKKPLTMPRGKQSEVGHRPLSCDRIYQDFLMTRLANVHRKYVTLEKWMPYSDGDSANASVCVRNEKIDLVDRFTLVAPGYKTIVPKSASALMAVSTPGPTSGHILN